MKEKIVCAKAPGAIGPYSQAIITGDLIFVSGQIPVNPETGTMADTIEKQTAQSLNNIKAILEEAGSSMDKVVKTTVLMTNLGDFSKMNDVYATFFKDPAPARAAFQVVALPKGAMIEIEVVAER
ncbi:MAG: RidA family protein [Erysipelotrichaceae bacterium]|nr:RidA family protein [Erysipelotrichaceae bacterium]